MPELRVGFSITVRKNDSNWQLFFNSIIKLYTSTGIEIKQSIGRWKLHLYYIEKKNYGLHTGFVDILCNVRGGKLQNIIR